MDLQKHLSGITSPAIASPSCEIKSELSFPPLPAATQTQQPQSAPPSQPETAKITPKISELSVLEEQLSKIHQKPFTQPAQHSPHPSYSEAVRQSPTTVQQQFPQQTVTPQISAPQQTSVSIINTTSLPVVSTAAQNVPAPSAQKVSRFQVSKVEEQKSSIVPSGQQQTSKPLTSPDVETQNVQQLTPQQPIQPSQAQAFFQQHQGGVVSKNSLYPLKHVCFPITLQYVFSTRKNSPLRSSRVFAIIFVFDSLHSVACIVY